MECLSGNGYGEGVGEGVGVDIVSLWGWWLARSR